jgi:hypothetical protein
MKAFLYIFLITTVLFLFFITLWGIINHRRKKRTGCSGNHDCVVYKGEKVTCPACDLREYQSEKNAKKVNPNPSI